MARKGRITTSRPRIGARQRAILEKYADIRSTMSERVNPYELRRGPSEYNILQKSLSVFGEEFDLKQSEKNSMRGYARRIRNVIKLAKTNPKIAAIMHRRFESSDLKDKFGGRTFSELTQKDVAQLVEYGIAYGGVIKVPDFNAPKDGTITAKDWDS